MPLARQTSAEADADSLRVQFELTVEDVVAFLFHLQRPHRRQAYLVSGMIAFVTFAAVMVATESSGLGWKSTLVLVAALGNVVWSVHRSRRLHVTREVAKQVGSYSGILGPWGLAISGEGVRVEAPGLQQTQPWSRLSRVERDREGIYFISDRNTGWVLSHRTLSGHFVPARAFQNVQEAEEFFKKARRLLRSTIHAERNRELGRFLLRAVVVSVVFLVVVLLLGNFG